MNKGSFTEDDLISKTDPFLQFEAWQSDANRCGTLWAQDSCLSTCARDGTVSSRLVSVDSFSREGGFVFYTSSVGRKAGDLAENPRCALHYSWPSLQRQVRIEGTASRIAEEEGGRGSEVSSESYFRRLPFKNQVVLSVVSPLQSREVRSREELLERCETLSAEHVRSGEPVPKPESWVGYRVQPTWIEFHQSYPDFFSDRLVFTRPAPERQTWELKRLVA